MRLTIPQPELKINILSFIMRIDKKLSNKIIAAQVDRIDSLIVLGDGNEDARVVSLLCHHLDGEKVVGLIKPELRRYSAIKELKERNYIRNFRSIVFIFDQEDDKLEELYGEVKKALNDAGIGFEEGEKFLVHRVMSYNCYLAGHKFKLVIVVNGLDDVGGSTHKIEDHLVMLAGLDGNLDSKDIWQDLEKGKRLDVFRRIYGDREVAERVFGQHFARLGLVDC